MATVREQVLRVGGCLLAAGALLLGALLLYSLHVRVSLQREVEERLRDPDIARLLAPVTRAGDTRHPAVLFLHGFGGSPHDFGPLLDAMPAHLGVYAPILPGHGTHSPAALREVRAAQWQEAARNRAMRLSEEYPGVILVGFSLGGLLALDLADEVGAEAVIVINPFVGAPYKFWYLLPPAMWVHTFSGIVPYVKKVKSGQIADPAGVGRYEPGYWHLSMRAFQGLHAYARQVRKHAAPLSVPVYWHFSEHDMVSDPNSMADLAERMGAEAAHLSTWSNSNHVLLYDHDAPAAIRTILKQILRHSK